MSSEEKYILKRKVKAFFESLAYYLCRVAPINQNKVVMWTFEGSGGFGCSPKYIAQEMLRRNKEENTDFKIYWIVDDVSKEFPDGIVKVKDSLWNRAYHFATSKVWVGNTRTFLGTKKRKGQLYIQTWHGTIFIKPIGLYRKEKFSKIAEIVSKKDSDLIDYVISDCKWCDEHYKLGLLYDGKISDIGLPRCDVLFNQRNEMRSKYRSIYNLKSDSKILLYAPTFRGGSQKTDRGVFQDEFSIDFERLINTLENKFGGEWYIFLRLHPQLSSKMKDENYKSDKIINVTGYSDMNELIATSDAFITDYSSAVFEAGLCEIPSFIYADDLKAYISDRGELMWKIEELPFSVSYDNDDLENNIQLFDDKIYKQRWNEFKQKFGFNENGNSSKNVVDLIIKELKKR